MKRALKIAAALVLVALVGAGAGLYGVATKALSPVDPTDNAASQTFSVTRGSSLARVANELERARLIRDARALRWLARYRGVAGKLHVGEYELKPSATPQQILDIITSGAVKTYEVVLPEGIRASEIAQRIEDAGLGRAEAFMGVVENPAFVESLGFEGDTLEGYLYPETYRLPRNLPPEEIARFLVRQFENVWTRIEPLVAEQEMTRREIVTLASIVEKETAAPEERPLIAAVFLNRMRQGMRLETDPTVIYGIPNFDGNLRRKHLEDPDNPYNTYQIKGLPPGPIASPGEDALRAILTPADSDYLYFVSRNDGTHKFSITYREHVNAVNRFQKRRRSK